MAASGRLYSDDPRPLKGMTRHRWKALSFLANGLGALCGFQNYAVNSVPPGSVGLKL